MLPPFETPAAQRIAIVGPVGHSRQNMPSLSACVVALAVLASTPILRGQSGEEYFERKVRPLLVEHCSQCHGEKLQSAEIDLRKPETVLGTAVISGDESSPLIRAVRYESPIKMPPGTKLPEEAIQVLVDWVRMGAPWPGYEPIQAGELPAGEDTVESDHWAFQPVADPEVPDVGESAWVRNDIDRFILAKLRESGLTPPAQAPPLTLLRRAKFDLQGLPPNLEEMRRLTADAKSGAFGRMVEELLASPHYGERWGRHWLDVARYADSTGVDEDHPFGDSWRYRDYVVNAFNADLRFDQFIREQIAGDLLTAPQGAAVNARGIVATGFLALGPMALAQRDPVQKRYDVVDEQIDTLSKAFLGLTVACARCHDHKFDPILTSDYYALAGILASTRTFDDWSKNGSRYFKQPLVEQAVYEEYKQHATAVAHLVRLRGVARQVATARFIAAGPASQLAEYMLAAVGHAGAAELDAEAVAWFRKYLEPRATLRPHLEAWRRAGEDRQRVANAYQEQLLDTLADRIAPFETWLQASLESLQGSRDEEAPDFPSDLPTTLFYGDLTDDGGPLDLDPDDVAEEFAEFDQSRIKSLKAKIAEARKAMPEEPPMANSVAEGDIVRQRVFRRGQHKHPGAAVAKRFPLVLVGTHQPEIGAGSGRRELADWLASEENPLTARVIVNRVWQWHFGEGLVRTPNNYGIRGEAPTHPLLLDWLARKFISSGWSIKALHRLIMDSATYRMSSAISELASAKDPENRLWSRFDRRRVTIEELRDSYLQVGGRLDAAVGGDTDLGAGELVEFDRNNRRIDPDDYSRRSIYLPLMRNKLPALLGLFDFGDATTANGKRSVTNVAPQALYLLNSGFAATAASGVAEQLIGSTAARIDQAYRLVLARPPSAGEASRATQYLRLRAEEGAAWASFCKLLLASNEFHYIE